MISLPDKLAAEFKKVCNIAPTAVARALSAMDGNAGATWVATDNNRLIFFTRKQGSNDFEMLPYLFSDASELSVDDDGKFSYLLISFADREVKLKFSTMEQMTLAKLENLWTPITRQGDLRAPVEMTPMLIFLAALQALIQADKKLASQELGWIKENQIDTNSLRRAGAWLRDNSVDALIAVINERFDETQKVCLHAKLVSLAMADGAYRTNEAKIINRIREGTGLSEEHHDGIFDFLLARNNVSVFAEGEEAAPEALNLAGATLLAMCEFDGQRHERVERMVNKLIGRHETMNVARTYLEQLGIEGILDYLPDPLNDVQRRFIILNLLRVATAEGPIDEERQALLDRFRDALQVDQTQYDADLHLHLTQQDISIFAPPKEKTPETE